jgi:hypothetical protein
MFYVGLDIHSTRIAICVLGETGQVARRAHGLGPRLTVALAYVDVGSNRLQVRLPARSVNVVEVPLVPRRSTR